MKLLHERVIDTSVLYARRNGSKMKLKTLAYQILNVNVVKNIEINSSWIALLRVRLSSDSRTHET